MPPQETVSSNSRLAIVPASAVFTPYTRGFSRGQNGLPLGETSSICSIFRALFLTLWTGSPSWSGLMTAASHIIKPPEWETGLGGLSFRADSLGFRHFHMNNSKYCVLRESKKMG